MKIDENELVVKGDSNTQDQLKKFQENVKSGKHPKEQLPPDVVLPPDADNNIEKALDEMALSKVSDLLVARTEQNAEKAREDKLAKRRKEREDAKEATRRRYRDRSRDRHGSRDRYAV